MATLESKALASTSQIGLNLRLNSGVFILKINYKLLKLNNLKYKKNKHKIKIKKH
jgi:hypothetical protein